MFSGWHRKDHPPEQRSRPSPANESSPSRAALAATRPGATSEALALDWAAAVGALVTDVCIHGGRAGRMRTGLPWCPDCRTQERRPGA